MGAGRACIPQDIPLPAQQRAMQRQAGKCCIRRSGPCTTRGGQPWLRSTWGGSLRTIQRDLQSATFAGRKHRSDRGESVLNPYKPYLLARWKRLLYCDAALS